jgi:hypothetical protein
MKLLQLLKELVVTPEIKNLQYKLEEEGYTKVGSGNYGIVMQKGNVVKKITTDFDELIHAENLVGHTFKTVIPIKNVTVIKPNLGIIEMVDAQQLTTKDKQELEYYKDTIEGYLEGSETLLSGMPTYLADFIRTLKANFESAGLEPSEIDWSSDNVMKYKGNFVLVDV